MSMTRCLACRKPLPEQARFCAYCGQSADPSEAATKMAESPTGQDPSEAATRFESPPQSSPASTSGAQRPSSSFPSSSGASWLSSRGPDAGEGFPPGTLLKGRYRIVGLVGKGGMGEVYRADDLKLGQAVALKFLPTAFSADLRRISRFLEEVRVARQISHPNVCRVHDVDEAEGRHFLSMEFIDGEDLASLLRRIGRLPSDKAADLARQLCAGLEAAHETGVLHRDLKPANVMVDGRGRVRIADFGLAAAAEEIAQGEVSGTPAYMAPEQLSGREVTVRSDLYALGLVLYEMFTGKRAFQAQSLQELTRLKEESSPEDPSALVDGIDPAAAAIILRCLHKDPAQRPRTALDVAAALPGGDPLARALAAGETPSPEMVAAGGKKGVVDSRTAALWLAGLLAGMLLFAWMSDRLRLHHWVELPKPPQALADRAQEHLKALGFVDPPKDSAYAFDVSGEVLSYLSSQDRPDKWEELRTGIPPAAVFWYRISPRILVPGNDYLVSFRNPPQLVSGMASLILDMQGRLLSFAAVPPQLRPELDPSSEADWGLLFRLAGLERSDFTPVDPQWNPPGYADTVRAWSGCYPERPELPIRVVAASQAGKPVYFQLLGPWSRSERTNTVAGSIVARFGAALSILLSIASLAGAALLARRNLRSGRGDRQGAFRLAAFIFSLSLADWCLRANHSMDIDLEWDQFILSTGRFLFVAGFLWLLYMGLEPTVRRIWPHNLISWTRLMRGEWRDHLVGRDILYGCALGVAACVLSFGAALTAPWLGLPPHNPQRSVLSMLSGTPQFLGSILDYAAWGLQNVLIVQFVLLVLRMLLRKDWLAAIALVTLFTFAGPPLTGGNLPLILFFNVLLLALVALTLMRLGLLAVVVLFMVAFVLLRIPITTDFAAWYGTYSLLALLGVAALGAWGFHVTRLGSRQPLLHRVGG